MRHISNHWWMWTLLLIVTMTTPACGFLFSNTPTMSQAELKAIETRRVEAPIEAVFTAATEALFDLGYLIKHSERASGVLLGEKQHTESRWVSATAQVPGHFESVPVVDSITLLIQPDGKKATTVRIKTSRDGAQRVNRDAINEVWVFIDRQVLMNAPAPGRKAGKKVTFEFRHSGESRNPVCCLAFSGPRLSPG